MREWVCERCGDVLVDEVGCRCATPYDPVAVRRRHREAVARARHDPYRLDTRDPRVA